jgi:PAS domain-containing protein
MGGTPMRMDALLSSAVQAVITHEKHEIGAFDDFPIPTYVTDSEGVIRHYNRACIPFAGRVPKVGTDKWCVSWELYSQDGRRLPHDQCPMAISIREKRPVEGARAIARRPDGTKIEFEPSPVPIFDGSGGLIGAVNLLRPVGQAAQVSSLWAEAARCRRLARSIDDEKAAIALKGRARDCERKAVAF